jgi:hypothetical protein
LRARNSSASAFGRSSSEAAQLLGQRLRQVVERGDAAGGGIDGDGFFDELGNAGFALGLSHGRGRGRALPPFRQVMAEAGRHRHLVAAAGGAFDAGEDAVSGG